ncbi:MAG: phosphoenolpyruvate carboxykinase (ATP), partial [Hyphomicrobium sp.]
MSELFPTQPTQKVHRNLREAELIEFIVRRGEGKLAQSGAVAVETGQHTGRSAEDKYIVRDDETDGAIWWD